MRSSSSSPSPAGPGGKRPPAASAPVKSPASPVAKVSAKTTGSVGRVLGRPMMGGGWSPPGPSGGSGGGSSSINTVISMVRARTGAILHHGAVYHGDLSQQLTGFKGYLRGDYRDALVATARAYSEAVRAAELPVEVRRRMEAAAEEVSRLIERIDRHVQSEIIPPIDRDIAAQEDARRG